MTALTIITPSDLQTAQGVHQQSAQWLAAYENSHTKLIAKADAIHGAKLPVEFDAKLNRWQESAKQALQRMEAERKPFTEKAHAFIKAFTEQENRLNAMYKEIQAIRDASATAYRKEEAERLAKERQELARKTERVDLLANASNQVREAYAAILEGDKSELLDAFEKVTLDNIDEYEAILREINPVLKYDRWTSIEIRLSPTQLNNQQEIDAIKTEALEFGDKFDKAAEHYKSEITRYAQHLLTLLPHRRKALENPTAVIDNTAEELRRKQERLAEDQRKAAEEAATKAAEEAKAKMELQQRVEEANRHLEQPRAIESYSITVTSRAGWAEIFKYYLIHQPETADEDLGKVKLDSMRIFAERRAKQRGELISHPDVVYEPKYKVTVRQTKGKTKKAA